MGVEYVGRSDDQVKVRGFRIELGEIETALRSHPSVAQTVASIHEEGGQKRLIAYFVSAHPDAPDSATLREYLAEHLPPYMVPALVVRIDTIPLTRNGKIDRRALPAPEFKPVDSRLPSTPQEKMLAEIFAAVLGVKEVGAGDNFFGLGGDSIGSLQLVGRARRLGWTLTARDVFQYQTVEALAKMVTAIELPTADANGVEQILPTPIYKRWLERHHRSGRFYQSVLLQVPTGIREDELTAALQAILDHHDMLRLRFRSDLPDEYLQIGEKGSIAASRCLLRITADSDAPSDWSSLIQREQRAAQDRIDPECGLTLQAVWIDGGPLRKGRLLLVAHHFAVDGVSWRILLEDLHAAWRAVREGSAFALPPVVTSFRRRRSCSRPTRQRPADRRNCQSGRAC